MKSFCVKMIPYERKMFWEGQQHNVDLQASDLLSANSFTSYIIFIGFLRFWSSIFTRRIFETYLVSYTREVLWRILFLDEHDVPLDTLRYYEVMDETCVLSTFGLVCVYKVMFFLDPCFNSVELMGRVH